MIEHFDLCKITAMWALKKANVCLFEYQSYATSEFPDVLSYKNNITILYEIKVNKQDFLKDFCKDSRQVLRDKTIKIKRKKYFSGVTDKNGKFYKADNYYKTYEKKIKQYPHLGKYRYYVCPARLIDSSEVKYFGLYWYKNNKFYLKKESEIFRNNIYSEQRLLIHALRKKRNMDNDRIIVKEY